MGAAMVFDAENGIAYEGYNAELIRAFLILVHYTDLDLSQYDTPQGRYEAYDMIASHGLWETILKIVAADMVAVDSICYRLQYSAQRNFEHRHSLEYRICKLFEGLLGTENLTETVAKAEGLNSKLIDMLEALRKTKPMSAGGLQFAKKGRPE